MDWSHNGSHSSLDFGNSSGPIPSWVGFYNAPKRPLSSRQVWLQKQHNVTTSVHFGRLFSNERYSCSQRFQTWDIISWTLCHLLGGLNSVVSMVSGGNWPLSCLCRKLFGVSALATGR